MFFRTGGGYITFEEFLRLYAKDQVMELIQFAETENLKIDEVLRRFEGHYIEEYYSATQGGLSENKVGGTRKSPERDIKNQLNVDGYREMMNKNSTYK